MKSFGPFYLWRDHNLFGYGGTWSRRWHLGVRLLPFSFGCSISVSRVRASRTLLSVTNDSVTLS